MGKGGYISLDTFNKNESKGVAPGEGKQTPAKLTWYKTAVEPCVGTSLFFEVPIARERAETKKLSTATSALSRQASIAKKKTLVLNPAKVLPIKRLHSGVLHVNDESSHEHSIAASMTAKHNFNNP